MAYPPGMTLSDYEHTGDLFRCPECYGFLDPGKSVEVIQDGEYYHRDCLISKLNMLKVELLQLGIKLAHFIEFLDHVEITNYLRLIQANIDEIEKVNDALYE